MDLTKISQNQVAGIFRDDPKFSEIYGDFGGPVRVQLLKVVVDLQFKLTSSFYSDLSSLVDRLLVTDSRQLDYIVDKYLESVGRQGIDTHREIAEWLVGRESIIQYDRGIGYAPSVILFSNSEQRSHFGFSLSTTLPVIGPGSKTQVVKFAFDFAGYEVIARYARAISGDVFRLVEVQKGSTGKLLLDH